MTTYATTNTKKYNKHTFTYNGIQDLCFLLYFCIWHTCIDQTPINSVLRKTSFILCILPTAFVVLKSKKFIINGYIKWLFLFLAYNTISLLWTRSISDSYIYINSLIKMFLIAICLSYRIKTRNDINKIIKMFVFSTVYMSLLLLIMTPSSDWGTNQLGGSIGLWKNTVGAFSSIGAILAIYLFFISGRSGSKTLYFLAICLLCFITVYSGSRKALVLVLLACMLVFLFYKDISFNITNILKKILIGVLFLVLIGAITYIIRNNEKLYDLIGLRVYYAFDSIMGKGTKIKDGSIIERAFYIEKAKQLFALHPILGYGANGFLTHMREISYSHVAYSHNNFWELLSTLGLVGFILYYYMQFKLIVGLYPQKYLNSDTRILAAFLWALTIAILICGYWSVYSYEQFYNTVFILGYFCMTLINKKHIYEL